MIFYNVLYKKTIRNHFPTVAQKVTSCNYNLLNNTKMKRIITILISCFFALSSQAQLPICDTGSAGFVYIKSGKDIYQYNTITDTTILVSGVQVLTSNSTLAGDGLAVMPITNGFQTDYTWVTSLKDSSPGYIKYATFDNNNSAWNFHDIIPTIGAVNMGSACGTGTFNFDAKLGFVYNFDSVSNNSPLVSNLLAPASPNNNYNGMYDVVGDIDGNFYILITNAQGAVPRGLHKYDPSGNLLNTWTISGIHNNYGAGLAIAGGKVYSAGNSGIWVGTLSGTNINFIQPPNGFRFLPVTQHQIGDLASCPNMPAFGSTLTTLRPNCSGNQAPLSTQNYLNNFELLGLSPNPAFNKITLELNSEKGDELDVEIINLNGQKLYAQKYPINSGRNLLKVDNLDFSSGIYFLKVTNKDHKQFVRKISFR